MNYREELSTRLVSVISTLETSDITIIQREVDSILNDYDVEKATTALVANDIHEKLQLYIACKILENLSKGTLENYVREITNFSRYITKPVNQITTMDIRQYAAMHYGHLKATTINSKLSRIRAFFEWLHDEGYIDRNPAKNIKPLKTEKRVRKYLTAEELEIFRTHCHTLREKALLEFMYATGCRVDEVVKTNITDINFTDMSLMVIGKGDKERRVYISPKAKVILLQYIRSRKDCNPALFINVKGGKRISTRSIQRIYVDISQRFGKHVHPHMIRHTFATHAINSGVPVSVVQQLLGHATPATTMIYAQLDDTTIKTEYRKIS